MSRPERRTLPWALAFSILLHASTMLILRPWAQAAQPRERLWVDLVYVGRAVEVTADSEAGGPDAEERLPQTVGRKPEEPASEAPAPEGDEPAPGSAQAEEGTAAEPDAEVTVPEPGADAGVPGGGDSPPHGTAAAPAGRPAYDPGLTLAGLLERLDEKRIYPRAARRRGIQGTVILLVRLDRRGELEGLSVLKSSGSDILDRAAVRLIESVLPYDHGAGRSIRLEVPITYRLKEG